MLVVVFCVTEASDEVANIAMQRSVERWYVYEDSSQMMLTLERSVYRAALK